MGAAAEGPLALNLLIVPSEPTNKTEIGGATPTLERSEGAYTGWGVGAKG